MPVDAPNFSPYPSGALTRYTRAEAALVSMVARWLVPRGPSGSRVLASLVGATPTLRLEACPSGAFDPHAASVEVRAHGASAVVSAPSQFVRDVAQRLLGGPDELAAPRPLTAAEHGVWAVLVSAALTDAGLPGEVWPGAAGAGTDADASVVELTATIGPRVVPIRIRLSAALATRVPPPRAWPGWTFDVPILVGGCLLPAEAVARLRVRDVVVIERRVALRVGDGDIDLAAATGAVEATVASGYNRRAMTAPTSEAAELELTVQLGTTRMSLRQLADLAPGAVVPLGRPLAGPFEVRAAGRLIGQGELVDVDGELGVRIVSLQE